MGPNTWLYGRFRARPSPALGLPNGLPMFPVPTAWIELDVDDVGEVTKELQEAGYRLLVTAREEPWGQTATRFMSPDGMLMGLTYTPWMR